MIKAAICTIGDEILIGQIVDTNSGEISRALQNAGIAVRCHISIADDREEILSTLADLARKCDVMITTGGLGPTRDDITKEALRILSGSAGYRNDVVQEGINREILGARGVAMSDINLAQSQVPERAEVIPNRLGTAPGMVFRGVVCRGVEGGAGATLYALPGVPFETRALIPQVISDICTHFETAPITHRTIVTFGIPESVLAKEIEGWERALPPQVHLAYLPNPLIGVRLRLTGHSGAAMVERYAAELKELMGTAAYGEGDDTLPVVLGRMLTERGKTMSAAESCTGGRISSLMTAVPGCSGYYMGSVTSYDNSVKMGVLGVEEGILRDYGAVSEECVRQMAAGVLLRFGTDFSVATSGIAGPGGGSAEKPVGMAWIAAACRRSDGSVDVTARKVQFSSSRQTNIDRFASNALNLLRLKILESDNC